MIDTRRCVLPCWHLPAIPALAPVPELDLLRAASLKLI